MESIYREAEALSAKPGGIDSHHDFGSRVRPRIARAAVLQALAEALESGDEGYRPPTPGAIAERQGRAIVRMAMAVGITFEELVSAVKGRLQWMRGKGSEPGKAVESLFQIVGLKGGLESLRSKWIAATREEASFRFELEALQRTAEGIEPSLGEAISAAVNRAGGADAVSGELADIRLIGASGGADRGEGELASLRAQMRSLGVDSTGRAAVSLKARIDELATTIDRRHDEARTKVKADAKALVESALRGNVRAWRSLADAVKGRPEAFGEGLGQALEEAPMVALERAGLWAGFAGVMVSDPDCHTRKQ